MAEKYGIEETKEVLKALNNFLVVFGPALKKGVTALDLIASLEKIMTDPVCKADLEAALAGIDQLPNELGDISFMEMIELALFQAKLVPAIVQAFAKEAK